MITGTPVSVEEYLSTSYEPRCEYIDGALVPKAMATWKHGRLQLSIAVLIEKAFPHYDAIPELTVRITEKEYLIPDLGVDRRDRRQDPYPVWPIHLSIEIVSPDDRLNELLSKCETYHAWGVPHAWVIDPQTRRAWQYSKGEEPREVDSLGELLAGDIHIRVADIFSALD